MSTSPAGSSSVVRSTIRVSKRPSVVSLSCSALKLLMRFHLSLPKTLFVQPVPAFQQAVLHNSTGHHAEALGQAFLLYVMQLEKFRFPCPLGESLIAGIKFVRQILYQRCTAKPPHSRRHIKIG